MGKCLRLLMIIALFTPKALAKTYDVAGNVRFEAVGHPGFIGITGDSGHVVGTAEETAGKIRGTFKVKLADFDTGLDLRNRHMREKYLQVATYPEAKLVMDPWVRTKELSTFSGMLTLKGLSHAVIGHAQVDESGQINANFTVVLDDFKVGVPSWAGVTVAKDVKVFVEAKAK